MSFRRFIRGRSLEVMCPVSEGLLVTGASGLLGKRLMEVLTSLPLVRVIAVLRDKKRALPEWENVLVIEGDLCSFETWKKIPRDITHVFHLAARLPFGSQNKNAIARENIKPVQNLIKASKNWRNLKQVIYSSSISVAHPPLSVYSEAKKKGEVLLNSLKSRKIKVCCLRLSSIYDKGKNDGTVLPLMIQNAVSRKQIKVYGKGIRTQDFLHARDAAQAMLRAYRRGASGIFNIGSGKAVPMKVLARAVNRIFACGEAEIIYEAKKPEGAGIKMNISPARRSLKYFPKISLRRGLLMLKKDMLNP